MRILPSAAAAVVLVTLSMLPAAPALAAPSDIGFNLSANNDFPEPGQSVTVTLQASNNGPAPQEVHFIVSVAYVEAFATVTTPPGATYDAGTHSIRWAPTLPASQDAVLNIPITIDADAQRNTLLSVPATTVEEGPSCGPCDARFAVSTIGGAEPPLRVSVFGDSEVADDAEAGVALVNTSSEAVAFDIGIATADLNAKAANLQLQFAGPGTLSDPDGMGVRHWTGTIAAEATAAVLWTYDLPGNGGAPVTSVSLAVWGDPSVVTCRNDQPALCAGSWWVMHRAFGGAAVLPKTGVEPWAAAGGAALLLIAGLAALVLVRRRGQVMARPVRAKHPPIIAFLD